MKVIISSDSVKFPLTGIGRYTYKLITAFGEMNAIDDLKFLNGYSVIDSFNFGHTSANDVKNSALKTKMISFLKSSHAAVMYRILLPYLKSRALNSHPDYIFHGTNFFVPKFKGRSISTFHDLSPFAMPQCIEPKRRDYLQKQLTETVKNASFFITDTEHTRNEFIDYFGVDKDKIQRVHLACDESFTVRTEQEVASVLNKYDLNFKQFTLCVSTIEPRKNLNILVESYRQLPVSIRTRYPLVLVGHEGWCSDEIHAKIIRYSMKGWLRYLNFVHNDELPIIYSAARLFVFPSLYEGFGLPILEAMGSGVPILCSNASCLPEVAGNSALFFEPNDIDGLRELLCDVLENEELLAKQRSSGLARAREFSWQRCAYETLQVYQRVNQL